MIHQGGFQITCCNLDDVHHTLMSMFSDEGNGWQYESAPRGKKIRELIAPSFTVMDPRDRLVSSKARAVNYGFAVGELCWYVRGDTDLETMLYYNRRMSQFSDDGTTINSAYGARIFNERFSVPSPARTARDSGPPRPPESISQFDAVCMELRKDPDSRRAVMHINEPSDLFRAVTRGSKDVPCTMSLQLFIRDRRLHMHALMRSNDVVWGLPYDVFSFTCLQEAFLYRLQEAGVPVDDLGYYHHTAGSLHIYDTHFAMAGEVRKERPIGIAPMKPFTLAGIQVLAEQVEPDIRNGEDYTWGVDGAGAETETWMVNQLVNHRLKRLEEARKKEKNEQQA